MSAATLLGNTRDAAFRHMTHEPHTDRRVHSGLVPSNYLTSICLCSKSQFTPLHSRAASPPGSPPIVWVLPS